MSYDEAELSRQADQLKDQVLMRVGIMLALLAFALLVAWMGLESLTQIILRRSGIAFRHCVTKFYKLMGHSV